MANQTLYTFKANLQDLVKLQKEIAKAQQELNKLKKTDKEYQAQQKKLGDLQGKFNKTAGAMKNATGAANNLNKAGGKLINTFKSAAVAIGAAFAVRAIVGSIKSIISTFSEFEAQMAAVKAISGATGEEFKVLEASALKLGASTVFTATQVGKLQEEFARLGFTVEEIDAATVSTLNLAAATGESLANSAQIAGSTLRAFNLDAEQTQRVTDVMASSFTNSALNLERFKESMKFVAPVARATGFTLEETSSLLMNLADNGLTGSIAGNALKNVFLKLGDANSKLAKKLGGPVQGLPQLVEAMKKLKEEGFSATEAVDLLDKRSAPAFLALIKNIEGLESGVDILNMTEGAVNRMAAIRLDTLQGDFTILKSAAEGLSIALGDQFDISLRNIVYSLTKFIQKVTESETALKVIQRTVQFLGAAIVGLTARFAAMGLSAVVNGLRSIGTAMVAMTRATVGATASTNALKAALAATPWGLVTQAVTTLAASIFFMGDEMEAAEMKQRRLTDAMNESIDGVLDLNDSTKERANSIRQLVNDFPEMLKFLDLELATNAQLGELKKLLKREDLIDMQQKIEDNKKKIDMAQAEVDASEALLDKLRANHKEQVRLYGENSQEAINAISKVTRAEDRRNYLRDTQIPSLKKRNKQLLKETENYIKQLKTAQNLLIKDGDTYRMQLRVQYLEELNAFREMSEGQKEEELKRNKDRLAYVTAAVEYNDMIGESMEKFGKITPQVQKEVDLFLEGSGFKDRILNDATSAQKLNVELSELRKFISNLESSFVRTGNSADDFGSKAGFALNKTKDQYKKLSKLLDDLVDNQFDAAIKQSENQRNASLKANDEQIALMRTNMANIRKMQADGSKEELAALIKANKSKFNAIKNLTIEEYNDATDAENGHKDKMLEILQAMLDEEDAKLKTAFVYQAELYQSHNNTIAQILADRQLSNAEDVAAAGEQEQRELERNELNFFKVMRNRASIADKLDKERIKNIQTNSDLELQNLQTLRDSKLISEEEYQNAKVEMERKAQTEIAKIQQDAKDRNVQDQIESIQKIGEYYGMAFEAFSTFFTNRMALQKQEVTDFYDAEAADIDTSMQRELDAVEGNAQAQEDIRERYALIQEANEEKKQQELRKIKKEEFKVQKMNDIIMATINGALAITKVAGQTGIGAIAAAPLMSALVAAQIATIAAQKFVGAKGGIIPNDEIFARGGMVVGPSHADGGVKFAVGGRVAELEGGEAVINKRSTAMFRSQLSDMNVAGGGVAFANGGIMPGTSNTLQASSVNNTQMQFDDLASNIISGINSKEVIVTEASITTSQENVSVTELTSNIF
jgi:TP901 family phage tail tape measure protein